MKTARTILLFTGLTGLGVSASEEGAVIVIMALLSLRARHLEP